MRTSGVPGPLASKTPVRAAPRPSADPADPFGGGVSFRTIGNFVRENYFEFDYAKGTRQETRFCRDALGLGPGARVLDVACGPCRHSVRLAREWRITGADLSEGLLGVARRLAGDAGVGIELVQADARSLPFRAVFDGAFSFCEGAFGLLPDDEDHVRMLASVRDALRPGGRFLLSAMSAFAMCHDRTFDLLSNTMTEVNEVRDPEGRVGRFPVTTRAFTPREVLRMGASAGLRVVAVYGGVTGAYMRRPFKVDDPEMLVLFERPAQTASPEDAPA